MPSDFQNGAEFLVVATFFATAIIHIALAAGVYADASNLREVESKPCYFIGPFMWALTTLLTGLLGAAAYWLMHRSTLRRD